MLYYRLTQKTGGGRDSMKIVFIGAGAIGSLYGGMLHVAGFDVVLIGRPRNVQAVRQEGMWIRGVLGEHYLQPNVSDNALDVRDADFVFITTKTYDTATAAESARHLVERGAYIVLLQNGIGTEKSVMQQLSTTRVIRGTTCTGALLTRPNEVVATGLGLTEFGTHYHDNWSAVVEIARVVEKAGFVTKTAEDLDGVVWTKTIVNCGINPVGALTGMTNGEIYDNKMLRSVVIRLVEEAAAVVKALGVKLTVDDPVRYTLGTAKATAHNINSMLQDLRRGRRTEVDSITGEVVKNAKRLGISVPVSEAIYALIKALEAKRLLTTDRTTNELTMTAEELLSALSIH